MTIRYDKDDHIVVITIDRPEARNALDWEHFLALSDSWKRYDADEDARVAIITGVGDIFCAGADLKRLVPMVTRNAHSTPEALAQIETRIATVHEASLRSLKLYRPVIAAVNGPCVAAGMEMLGGIDIRVASTNATFGVLEPKRGLIAGTGTTVRLPRQIRFPAAMELLLCADTISAERALALGLLNDVVARDELLPRALEFARRIAVNSPFAVRTTKRSVLEGMAMDMEAAYANEARLSDLAINSADAAEGVAAFSARRPPRWANR